MSEGPGATQLPIPHFVFENGQVPFRHLGELGRGNVAIVDRVERTAPCPPLSDHPGQGREYARKVLKVSRFQRLDEIYDEISVVKRLRHHHVVAVRLTYEESRRAEWEKKTFGIIMEPVADCNLEEFFEMLNARSPAVGQGESVHMEKWFGCLASGLAFIHSQRIRHKDIRPANILVSNGRILFSNFGISNSLSDLAADTMTTGYPRRRTDMYCAPEVSNGEPRGRKADVFSLGCVFVEMLTLFCSRSLDEFAAWRGTKGFQAYHLNVDRVLRWLFYLRPASCGYHDYCGAILHPNPSRRISSEDLLKWISCDRDNLGGWGGGEGNRACACMGVEPVGTFWASSFGNRPPYENALDMRTPISWESATNLWVGRTCWNQTDRFELPTLVAVEPPLQRHAFPVTAAAFFEEVDNDTDGVVDGDETAP
ncbi:hypothetical protein GP486_004413 [Trichoglossum hirsutum]|uniref:EKC/KEOPS complex subunit BUD32 n=1 Tax=Trichoglossum hirsutum TaxID=265104 RepID=A0A9P8LB44_9PEZI|nr:hypothetical protein GP486_004413 [Trichoglossum hirsutum]